MERRRHSGLWTTRVKLTTYGGVNVPADMTVKGYGSVDNNFVVGGQFVVAAVPDMRASLSYMNRRRERESYWTTRPDPTPEALPMLIAPPPQEEEYAGTDVSYKFKEARFYGRYDYDLNLKKTQRGQAGVRYHVFADVVRHRGLSLPQSPRSVQLHLLGL